MKFFKSTTLATALLLGLSGAVNAVEIDLFDGTGPFSELSTGMLESSAAGTSSSGLGRTIEADAPDNAGASIELDSTAPGQYRHSNDGPGTTRVIYSLGGLDVTTDANAFRIAITLFAPTVSIGVGIDGGGIVSPFIFGTPSYIDILFSDIPGGAAAVASANTLTLQVTGATNGSNVEIDSLCTVRSTALFSGGVTTTAPFDACSTPPPTDMPEPATTALMGLGLLGLAGLRRRRS